MKKLYFNNEMLPVGFPVNCSLKSSGNQSSVGVHMSLEVQKILALPGDADVKVVMSGQFVTSALVKRVDYQYLDRSQSGERLLAFNHWVHPQLGEDFELTNMAAVSRRNDVGDVSGLLALPARFTGYAIVSDWEDDVQLHVIPDGDEMIPLGDYFLLSPADHPAWDSGVASVYGSQSPISFVSFEQIEDEAAASNPVMIDSDGSAFPIQLGKIHGLVAPRYNPSNPGSVLSQITLPISCYARYDRELTEPAAPSPIDRFPIKHRRSGKFYPQAQGLILDGDENYVSARGILTTKFIQ